MKRIVWILSLPALCLGWLNAMADELPTAEVVMIEVPRVYHLYGVVEAVNASTVAAQTNGQVKEVLFDVDDLVEAGSVIVVIDDSQQQAALAAARARLKQAQAQLADAEKEYRRTLRVYQKKVVPKATMDKARAARDQARAAVRQAEQQLAYTRVKAPYTGIVTRRLIEVGEVAAPGKPLMSGISLENLRLIVDVPQSLIEAVRHERIGAMRIGDRWIEAEKVTIFPVADPVTDTFRVRLQLPKGVQGVYPGMAPRRFEWNSPGNLCQITRKIRNEEPEWTATRYCFLGWV